MTKLDVLQKCTVDGNVVRLPEGQLDRKLYQDVAKSLELIGGKWKGGKVAGFVFQSDPTDLLSQIAGGENRNLKKEFQFFETSDELGDRLVELAVRGRDLMGGWANLFEIGRYRILEPSAGQGAIIRAIRRVWPGLPVYAYELMPINREILKKDSSIKLAAVPDFLECENPMDFHLIIANPPFSGNQDIDHVRQMYKRLAVGGRMVSIMSESWVSGLQKKQAQFRDWLFEVGAEIHDIDKGAFKSSGTMVGGKIVVIDK